MHVQYTTELEYAGFWSRVGASVIDTLLLAIIIYPLLIAVYGIAVLQSDELFIGPAHGLISYLLPALISIALWIKLSATPGKMAIGAVIVDARTGGKPSTRQCVIRYLGYYVSMLPLFLGFFWVAIDPRKQGWHDKMAGTVVVKRKGGSAEPVSFK